MSDDAYVAEASVKRGSWTGFARAERTENRELLELEDEDPVIYQDFACALEKNGVPIRQERPRYRQPGEPKIVSTDWDDD